MKHYSLATHIRLAFVGILVGILVGISSTAYTLELINGNYVWTFLSAQEWPLGYNQNTGKPDNLVWGYNDYPPEFFDRINSALPESHVNEAFLTDDAGANIHLSEEAEVFITFIHEGAGYKNSFGYFTYDKNNPPATPLEVSETIIFPNLSYPHLTNGHRLSLGVFPAGTSIGFFIAANGFWYDTGVKPFAIPYYYSLKDLNPDPTDALRQHNVLLFDAEVEEVIIGFEDLPRSWGDNDFNDAVFTVKSTPVTAIDTANLTTMPSVDDSDADGIVDSEDEFPDDYDRAYSAYYPSNIDYVTLAYEDNWPKTGDYDMNDLVIRERLQTTYNANGDISGFIIHGYIDARGAAYHNGFALRLLNLSAADVYSATLSIAGVTYDKVPESNQTNPVLVLWNDTHVFTETNEAGSCQHFNTRKDCTQFSPVSFTLDVSFANSPASLNHSSIDYFIFRTNNRGREIHFADYPPTDLFDQTQFGRYDDTSDVNTGRYFRNAQNLPWALQINTAWRYPQEYIDIIWAYPDYGDWAESSGQDNQNWYQTSDLTTHYY
ncbi:MAG: LruC domain-containing protein [Pseudomonadales bacterium]